MTNDSAARLHLHDRVRSALDEEAAETLMNLLPRDVTQLATKQDLEMLRKDLRVDIERSARIVILSVIAAHASMFSGAAVLAGFFG